MVEKRDGGGWEGGGGRKEGGGVQEGAVWHLMPKFDSHFLKLTCDMGGYGDMRIETWVFIKAAFSSLILYDFDIIKYVRLQTNL